MSEKLQQVKTEEETSSSENWTTKVNDNRTGTRLFHRVIRAFGIRAAYGMLFFAAWQYTLFDRNSVRALREFRRHCGLSCGIYDLYCHFYSFGRSLIDRHVLTTGTKAAKKFRFDYTNESIIAQEVDRGEGVILLGAHMGTWEIAGAFLGRRLSKPVHVFMYDQRREAPEQAVGYDDTGIIVHPVQAGGADIAVEIINALRAGEIVCMHGDRYFEGQRTLAIDFLGKSARFPAGPMAMAAITGASVVPCFALWKSLFSYEFYAELPIRIDRGTRATRDNAIKSGMRTYVSVLEDRCRRYPLQWYNFYSFWRDENRSRQSV